MNNRQTATRPADVSVLVSGGTNNSATRTPAVRVDVSRTFGERAAVCGTDVGAPFQRATRHGGRGGAERHGDGWPRRPVSRPFHGFNRHGIQPRLPGFRPGVNHGGAIEKRAGGHMFQ